MSLLLLHGRLLAFKLKLLFGMALLLLELLDLGLIVLETGVFQRLALCFLLFQKLLLMLSL
ncbi:MAG TPA: hypothetical protein VEK14_04500 [Rhodomicrobium sp.]|nr:hypothetical protein [Rhodomicrobium sp.]